MYLLECEAQLTDKCERKGKFPSAAVALGTSWNIFSGKWHCPSCAEQVRRKTPRPDGKANTSETQ